jgi:hypothetical protein
MKKLVRSAALAFIAAALATPVLAQGQVNIICSVQAEWCNLLGARDPEPGPLTGSRRLAAPAPDAHFH